MTRLLTSLAWIGAAIVALVAVGLFAVRGQGIGTRGEPSWVEGRAALFARGWLTPDRYKTLKNPVSASPEVIAEGRDHFADHCASCHGNDGSGQTELGQAFYPKTPDMRGPRTQALSDGELFYFIEHGVRFTGMPAWTTGTPEGEASSWRLVHFIRHLPALTPEAIQDMEALNPKSRRDLDHEREMDEFLNGGTPPEQGGGAANAHGAHGAPHD